MGCALVAPFATQGATLAATLGAFVLLCLIAAAGVFGYDRLMLSRAGAQATAARARAEQTSQAKSHFLATMSSELRAPLNEIVGYAELIEEEAGGATAEDAGRIKHAAHNLLRLLNVVGDVAKLESGAAALNRELTPVQIVLKNVKDAASPLAAANGAILNVAACDDLGEVNVDHMRLHHALLQVVAHVVRNAGAGTVLIEAARRRREGRDVLEFDVRDSGPALSAAQGARLFEPFAGDERGVGLAFARDIVRLMGGDVEYRSAPGQARVTLWLEV